MWPQTLCYDWTLVSSKNTCRLPEEKVWTIHGFWPAITQITGPNYRIARTNGSSISTPLKKFNRNWTPSGSMSRTTPTLTFLKYQWVKHGTCALSHSKLNKYKNELKYFKSTLEIFNSFDVTKILTKAEFHAGGKYFVQDLIKSIESFTGKNCQIDCIFYRQPKEYYLYQVKIYFDKSLKPIDCSKSNKSYSNCSFSKKVFYLKSVPNNPGDL
ncbi:LOW QUALITY PROTEIN: ribonuclease Oy-like [Cotesia typhae]|uniref:LOW QUALITY PROTEIN: ribonuclease Oy-like n=1 Tax=Cotesia typhae TaxID=2053667 RepID=UPI003D6992F6